MELIRKKSCWTLEVPCELQTGSVSLLGTKGVVGRVGDPLDSNRKIQMLFTLTDFIYGL